MSFLFNFWKKKKILPDVAIFEITFRCPYRCPFCYCPWENASAGEYPRSELSTGELKDALKMLKSCGVGQVTFSGGEPTSRSDFREILLYTRRELKLKVGIISNGYLIDEDFLDFIRPLIAHAAEHLNEGGVLLLEIGHEREHFEAAFPQLAPVWLPTSAGCEQVLLLTRDELQQH